MVYIYYINALQSKRITYDNPRVLRLSLTHNEPHNYIWTFENDELPETHWTIMRNGTAIFHNCFECQTLYLRAPADDNPVVACIPPNALGFFAYFRIFNGKTPANQNQCELFTGRRSFAGTLQIGKFIIITLNPVSGITSGMWRIFGCDLLRMVFGTFGK